MCGIHKAADDAAQHCPVPPPGAVGRRKASLAPTRRLPLPHAAILPVHQVDDLRAVGERDRDEIAQRVVLITRCLPAA